MTTRHAISAGFVPLLDSALLVVAREMGFAEPQTPFVPRVAKPGAAAPQAPRPAATATTPEQRRALFRVVASEE